MVVRVPARQRGSIAEAAACGAVAEAGAAGALPVPRAPAAAAAARRSPIDFDLRHFDRPHGMPLLHLCVAPPSASLTSVEAMYEGHDDAQQRAPCRADPPRLRARRQGTRTLRSLTARRTRSRRWRTSWCAAHHLAQVLDSVPCAQMSMPVIAGALQSAHVGRQYSDKSTCCSLKSCRNYVFVAPCRRQRPEPMCQTRTVGVRCARALALNEFDVV